MSNACMHDRMISDIGRAAWQHGRQHGRQGSMAACDLRSSTDLCLHQLDLLMLVEKFQDSYIRFSKLTNYKKYTIFLIFDISVINI
jgi:hypothetical protein